MSSIALSSIVFSCVFGGSLLGMILRAALPKHHLSKESQDIVKLGMGFVGTMAALVLGLLIGTTKGSYDKQKDEITELSASVLLLDRLLAHYGPETKPAREQLRHSIEIASKRIWPDGGAPAAGASPLTQTGEGLFESILQLSPKDDAQRKLQAEAQSVCTQLARLRLLLYEQAGSSISTPLLVILVFWVSIIFVSFGLFAPFNLTVVVTLIMSALSVSGAIFLILELDRPFGGLIRISDAPVKAVLNRLGQP